MAGLGDMAQGMLEVLGLDSDPWVSAVSERAQTMEIGITKMLDVRCWPTKLAEEEGGLDLVCLTVDSIKFIAQATRYLIAVAGVTKAQDLQIKRRVSMQSSPTASRAPSMASPAHAAPEVPPAMDVVRAWMPDKDTVARFDRECMYAGKLTSPALLAAKVWESVGDFGAAIDFAEMAVAGAKSACNPIREVEALRVQGRCCAAQADMEGAVAAFEQAAAEAHRTTLYFLEALVVRDLTVHVQAKRGEGELGRARYRAIVTEHMVSELREIAPLLGDVVVPGAGLGLGHGAAAGAT